MDENLFSAADLRNMLRHGGLRPDRDLLQLDISLSYALTEYVRVLDVMAAHGWSRCRCAPHAGHLLTMHVVVGLGLGRYETAADTGSPLGTVPCGARIADGRITLGDAPGLGFEAAPALMRLFDGLAG